MQHQHSFWVLAALRVPLQAVADTTGAGDVYIAGSHMCKAWAMSKRRQLDDGPDNGETLL